MKEHVLQAKNCCKEHAIYSEFLCVLEKHTYYVMSSTGTGKTHLSTAVALRALSKNFKVLFTPVSAMLYQLHASTADNTYYKKLEEYFYFILGSPII